MKVRSENYTDTGLKASVNQDSIIDIADERLSVFCVADGMGGHLHGELASKAITDKIGEWHSGVIKKIRIMNFADILDSFENAVNEVNEYIFREYNREGVCGSTLTALVIFEDKYAVFSAGDSRTYLKRGFGFSQLTSDDVWQNDSRNNTGEDPESFKEDPDYGKLTKSIGVKEKISISRITGMLKKRDVFFLCCDGVHKCIPRKNLKRLVVKPNEIVDAVMKAGAPDNFSFITVRVM